MTVILSKSGTGLDPIELATPHPHPVAGAMYGFPWSIDGSRPLSEWFTADYAQLWRSQPALRRVVEFIARNIAQLPIHVFRRVSDVDRVRLTDHPLAVTLSTPNPERQTRYRWVEALVSDVCLFDRSYTAVLGGGSEPAELLYLPAANVSRSGDGEALYVWGVADPIPLDATLHVEGYSPTGSACPPVETLRAVLAEDRAATEYRAELWRNAARLSGWIGRPATAPDWSEPARERFRQEWASRWTSGSQWAGGTPVLEEGMEFHAATATAQESQYVEARKLTATECAAAYQVPPPMVGLLENANYSSTKEFRKALYQDTLGPWLEMLTGELERQLLPRFDDVSDVYVEFNIGAKLAGAFDEQAELLTRAAGAPWMTRNEARARMNLPHAEGADELVVPLNVLVGGQPSPVDPVPGAPSYASAAPPELPAARPKAIGAKARPATRTEAQRRLVEDLRDYFDRQAAAVIPAIERGASVGDALDYERWDPPLAAMLATSGYALALTGSATVLRRGEADQFNPRAMRAWLATVAESTARGVNVTTAEQLSQPLADPRHVYEVARTSRAEGQAESWDCTAHNFGARDAARATRRTFKHWRVTSGNPRASHASLDGESVGIDEVFSNGARYPGDPALPVEERARCSCVCEYTSEEA